MLLLGHTMGAVAKVKYSALDFVLIFASAIALILIGHKNIILTGFSVVFWGIASYLFLKALDNKERASSRLFLSCLAYLLLICLTLLNWGWLAIPFAYLLSFYIINNSFYLPKHKQSLFPGNYRPLNNWHKLSRSVAYFLIFVVIARWAVKLIPANDSMELFSFGYLFFSLVALSLSLWHKLKWQVVNAKKVNSLPSVSLLIPARNETHALEECLENALKSDYPKLEIIALDDRSQDNTPDIIKSFAHDGVRFIEGKEPPPGWVGKNYALEQLAKAASGDYLIYQDVDARLKPDAITHAILHMIEHELKFVSIMPKANVFSLSNYWQTPIVDWWTFIIPWETMNSRPAFGHVMIFEKDAITEETFHNLRRKIMPEITLSRMHIRNNSYGFILTNNYIDYELRKKTSSYNDTRLRTYYPLLNKSPSTVATVTMLGFAYTLLPFLLIAFSILLNQYQNALIAFLGLVSIVLSFVVANQKNGKYKAYLNILFPFNILWEIYLAINSMLQYEVGTIHWKQRRLPQFIINK